MKSKMEKKVKKLTELIKKSLDKAKNLVNIDVGYDSEESTYEYCREMAESPEATRKIAGMLNSKIKRRRDGAADICSYAAVFGINLVPGKEEFIKALGSSEPNIREVASRCLEKVASKGASIAEALPALAAVASERAQNDRETRKAAILAIAMAAKVGDDISDAMDLLSQGLRSQYISIRQASSLALYYAALNKKTTSQAIKVLAEACKSSADNADYFAKGVVYELLKQGEKEIKEALKKEIGEL